MQVVINISDEKFDSVIKDQLSAVSTDEMHDALVKAVNDYFANNPKEIERLIFPYNSYDRYHEPSELLKDMVKSCDFSGLQPIVDACVQSVKTSHEEILKTLILEMISRSLVETYGFRDQLTQTIYEILSRMNVGNNG